MDAVARVQVSGPIAPYAGALVEEFRGLGCPESSVAAQLRLWAHLSRWLQEQRLGLEDLTPAGVEDFMADRLVTHVHPRTSRVLASGLAFLRGRGLVPAVSRPDAVSAVEVATRRFEAYLRSQRGVRERTVACYARTVQPFLVHLDRQGGLDPRSVTAAVVAEFIAVRFPGLSKNSAKAEGKVLRSVLGSWHADGQCRVSLASVVPPVASWRMAELPSGLAPGQVQTLLDAPDAAIGVGLRDRAVLLLLARLGLRCVEASRLGLEDVDWRAGTIVVHGKGNRVDTLPLPVEVGTALAAYLRSGRPGGARCRAVFLTAKAPWRPLAPGTVASIVRTAAARAGLTGVHAHQLRHTVATATLAAGAGLEEIGQLLRHRSVSSTAIYAKVDDRALGVLARPWPNRAGAR